MISQEIFRNNDNTEKVPLNHANAFLFVIMLAKNPHDENAVNAICMFFTRLFLFSSRSANL